MVLSENAYKAKNGQGVDLVYINSILPLADLTPVETEKFRNLSNPDLDLQVRKNLFLRLSFVLEDYAQLLLQRLGSEPTDWDSFTSEGELDISKRIIQDKILVLDRIRSPYNVGAIFRSADSFGIKEIILIEGTASPLHPHARRTARGCTDTVKWRFATEKEVLNLFKGYESDEILALELGGENLNTFDFPVRGIAVLGSEEFGISPDILKSCGTRITIPMAGTKGSLNVSVSAGILMQRWFSAVDFSL